MCTHTRTYTDAYACDVHTCIQAHRHINKYMHMYVHIIARSYL